MTQVRAGSGVVFVVFCFFFFCLPVKVPLGVAKFVLLWLETPQVSMESMLREIWWRSHPRDRENRPMAGGFYFSFSGLRAAAERLQVFPS
jgi:hypothetical protein